MILLRRRRRALIAEIDARLARDGVVANEDGANFFGLESRGPWQVRGNGYLAASTREIVFVMWLPRKEIVIARDRITSIDRAKWHLGKTFGIPLLRVRFTDSAARPDTAAWAVADLPAWEVALGT